MTSAQLDAQAQECARARARLGRAEDIMGDVVDSLHAAGLEREAEMVLTSLACLRYDRADLRIRFHLLRAQAGARPLQLIASDGEAL